MIVGVAGAIVRIRERAGDVREIKATRLARMMRVAEEKTASARPTRGRKSSSVWAISVPQGGQPRR
jgi:hypothetical protein